MAEKITRSEARGILQQLVKQQSAVAGLAAAIEADTKLEEDAIRLREELRQLVQVVAHARAEAETHKAVVIEATETAKKARAASATAHEELMANQKAVDASRREMELCIRQNTQNIETTRQAQLAEVDRVVRARHEAGNAEHVEHVVAARKELEALEERKASISREIAGILSRFSAR